MERGKNWDIFGPVSIWFYARLLWRGRRLQKPGSDVHQLGGDALVDPEGTVRFHHAGIGPADRPFVSTILESVISEN